MKGFAIGCGTIVGLLVLGVAYILLMTDLSPTPEELAAYDRAVAAVGGGGATYEGSDYAIQEINGQRTVLLVYSVSSTLVFECVLLNGEVTDIERRERLSPESSNDGELAI